MTSGDAFEDTAEVGLRIDAVELAGLDQRSEDRPMFSTLVGAGEERVFAIEGHHPFILPMSVASWNCITRGIPISGGRCWFDAWSKEQLANLCRWRGRQAS